MIKDAFRGKESTPKNASLIIVYMLSKAFHISPLEVYKMPVSLVNNLLTVHSVAEELKNEEMEKAQRQAKSGKYG